MIVANWRPNWRDASAYPERRTEHQWRWEFLRRLDDYVEAFKKYGADELSDDYLISCKAFGVRGLLDPAAEFHVMLFPTEHPHYLRFADRATHDRMWRDKIRLVTFDLRRPLKPQLAKAESQLRKSQESLGRPAEQRNHRAKWARYLRVLDAKAAKAKSADIAKALKLRPSRHADGFDPERLVSETLEQARAIQLRFKRSA